MGTFFGFLQVDRRKTRLLGVLLVSAALISGAMATTASAWERPRLMVSAKADRSDAARLASKVVKGDAYIFLTRAGSPREVRFYLDDRQLQGSPASVELYSPHDFRRTAADGKANPLDTAKLTRGTHQVTAVIVRSNGSYGVVRATFQVDDFGGLPVPSSTSSTSTTETPPSTVTTQTTVRPSTTTTTKTPTTVTAPQIPGTLTNLPAQPAAIMYGGGETRAAAYAHPGGLVIVGRDNYQHPTFKAVSAAGGTVLIYLDAIIDNSYGRYHQMLLKGSECGPAVPLWPGSPSANEWGKLNDFRVGSVVQQKLECVLEKMVAENPHMGGWFADDIGSRSWFPDVDWASWSSADKQAYRDGAVALTRTFRKVADRHGLVFLVNGTWTANDGGGYPDARLSGNAVADGGVVEHHSTGELSFWKSYACANQWASQSSVTRGKPFHLSMNSSAAELNAYAASNCFAYVTNQKVYDYAAPWTSFHSTGLPSRVTR